MIFQYVKRLKAPIESILTIELSKGNKGKDRGHIHKVKRLSKQTKYCEISLVFFLYARLKKLDVLWEHLGRAGEWLASTGFQLSKSKSFHLIFIKLGEYVCGRNVWTKFYNQPNPSQELLNYDP